jgi:hypothetical protein
MPVRNENVERSVSLIIRLFDRLSDGESLGKPAPRQIKAALSARPRLKDSVGESPLKFRN